MFEVVKENLEKKGYKVSCFETAEDAASYLLTELKGKSIGFGGSMTINEMRLFEKLGKENRVSWHWKQTETGMAPAEEAARAEIYFSSANALAETGEIVNIDGTGNRVGSTIFGHKKVYFVLGKNKLAANAHAAIDRARNVAAPKNAQRLARKTPCAAKADRCYDCDSPERICAVTSVFYRAPKGSQYEVILINQDLGF